MRRMWTIFVTILGNINHWKRKIITCISISGGKKEEINQPINCLCYYHLKIIAISILGWYSSGYCAFVHLYVLCERMFSLCLLEKHSVYFRLSIECLLSWTIWEPNCVTRTCSFGRRLFPEQLPQVGHCSRCWGWRSEQNRKAKGLCCHRIYILVKLLSHRP